MREADSSTWIFQWIDNQVPRASFHHCGVVVGRILLELFDSPHSECFRSFCTGTWRNVFVVLLLMVAEVEVVRGAEFNSNE